MTTTSCGIELDVPSPVRRLLDEETGELWVKDDGRICAGYGGNKPRKLVHLLGAALRRGAKRLVTVGAVGSHHVLATGLLGKRVGLPTIAIALPRPYSSHAEQTTIQTIAAGVELVALGAAGDLGRLVNRLGLRGDFWIPPGGSNCLGALGYLEAAQELERQILSEQIPEPDLIVVALGSGGTVAGLLAGLEMTGLASRVVAVSILRQPLTRPFVQAMARRTLKLGGYPSLSNFSSRLIIDRNWVGRGYGHPTAAGELAITAASALGLNLEATYTGKAFASALAWLRGSEVRGNVSVRSSVPSFTRSRASQTERRQRILFWSTYSAVPLATTTDASVTLPPAITRLFRSS